MKQELDYKTMVTRGTKTYAGPRKQPVYVDTICVKTGLSNFKRKKETQHG